MAEFEDDPLLVKRQEAALRAKNDFKAILETSVGRRFVWRLLQKAGPYRSSFSSDALAMAHSEGRRSAGIELLTLLEAEHFDKYVLMMQENNEELPNV